MEPSTETSQRGRLQLMEPPVVQVSEEEETDLAPSPPHLWSPTSVCVPLCVL